MGEEEGERFERGRENLRSLETKRRENMESRGKESGENCRQVKKTLDFDDLSNDPDR